MVLEMERQLIQHLAGRLSSVRLRLPDVRRACLDLGGDLLKGCFGSLRRLCHLAQTTQQHITIQPWTLSQSSPLDSLSTPNNWHRKCGLLYSIVRKGTYALALHDNQPFHPYSPPTSLVIGSSDEEQGSQGRGCCFSLILSIGT